jgi:hydroxymethylpyrimidine/phosphomethylpyrimidine kinase
VTPPVALSIAGSDSGGGAGLQADLITFAALGVFGTCAVSAITAQNTLGVRRVHPVPADVVIDQLEAVLDDLPVAAVKTGMLATPAIVTAIADLAAAGRLPRLVIDPVMVASSGDRLLDEAAVALYRERLLPHASAVTPNRVEAQRLLGRELHDLDDVRAAALELAGSCPRLVVITGGHPVDEAGGDTVDVAVVDGELHEIRAPRIRTTNDHGTGCTFSAAITAGLAGGMAPLDALRRANAYVRAALIRAAPWDLGAGPGPLDHLRQETTT